MNYIVQRTIQLAQAGRYRSLRVRGVRYRLEQRCRTTPSRARTRNNTVRITNDFMHAIESTIQRLEPCTGASRDERRRRKKAVKPKPRKHAEGQANSVGQTSAFAAWACADPGVQYRYHHQRMAYLSGRWPDQCLAIPCSEYMFRRRHRLQPGVVEPDDGSSKRQQVRVDRRGVSPCDCGCGRSFSKSPSTWPSSPADPRSRSKSYDYAYPRPGLRQPRHPLDGAGHPLRFAEKGRAHRWCCSLPSLHCHSLCHVSAEMASRSRAVPPLRAPISDAMLRVIRNHRRAAYTAISSRLRRR